MPDLVKVIARLVMAETGQPPEHGATIRMLDRDPLADDLLASAEVQEEGRVELLFPLCNVSSWDSPGECDPDIIICLMDGERECARSRVYKDVDFSSRHSVTGQRQSLTIDIGEVALASDG